MEIVIDYLILDRLANNPVSFAYWLIIETKLWIFLFIGCFLYLSILFWLNYRRGIYDKNRKYILLAIDIPKKNEQSPKAVEHIFEQISGAQTTPKWEDKWIKGKLPESFSMEIVSLGGYIQFLIQTNEDYRDLIEAAIYAQYPDAEIVEVQDYSGKFKGMKFPNEEYNLWGAEFRLVNKEFYPIKTYPQFEHSLSQELKDPMAALLEILSKLKPDEQVWFQIVLTPASDSWKKDGEILAKKLTGAKVKEKKRFVDLITDIPLKIFELISDLIWKPATVEKIKKEEAPSLMQYLSPGEKSTIEAVENKISKIGFNTKVRLIYLARHNAFSPQTRIDAIIGAIGQYRALDLNGFKLYKKKKTKVYGFFKNLRLNMRRTNLLRLYRLRARQYTPGYYGFVLNTEELATIYHFPVMTVKAPLLKKTVTKKAEPPLSLPIEEISISQSSASSSTPTEETIERTF